jgi:formate dehydrogenase subunit beta
MKKMNFMKWRTTMTKAISITKNAEQGVIDILKFLLEKGTVKGIFTLKKISSDGDVAYSLITSSEELNDAVPFYPLMPTNAGKLLSRFTLEGGASEPIAAVVKPCELRAFIELVKREQGNLENILFVSFTCGGVFPVKKAAEEPLEKHLSSYWDDVTKGNIPREIRPACKGCTEFIPYTADLTVDLIGSKDVEKQCLVFLNTKQAENAIKDFKAKAVEKDLEKSKLVTLQKKREAEKKQLFEEIDAKMKGMDGLIDIFGRCIGCHGCSKVCPICYCKLCVFESPDSEHKPSYYESELTRRGGLKVPPDTIYYHLGRLTHISISCVGCGSCEDVCPVDIPLSIIFKKVGENTQKMFEYIPGKNVEEEIPLVMFKEEELSEVEM